MTFPPKKTHHTNKLTNSESVPYIVETMIDLLKPGPDESVLHIGCGDGKITYELKDRQKSMLVVGLDSNAESIRHANWDYHDSIRVDEDKKPIERLHFLNPELEEMEGGCWEPFDKVFSGDTQKLIFSVPQKREDIFCLIFGLLKPGGRVVLSIAGRETLMGLRSEIAERIDASCRMKVETMWEDLYPTTNDIFKSLMQVGFQIKDFHRHVEAVELPCHIDAVQAFVKSQGAIFLKFLHPDWQEGGSRAVAANLRKPTDGSRMSIERIIFLAEKPR